MKHDRMFKVAVLGLTALTLASSLYGLHHANQKAECLANYNVASAQRSQVTSALANEQNDAVNDVITGVGGLLGGKPKTPGALAQLFATYKLRTDAVARERADHPPPTLPRDCR